MSRSSRAHGLPRTIQATDPSVYSTTPPTPPSTLFPYTTLFRSQSTTATRPLPGNESDPAPVAELVARCGIPAMAVEIGRAHSELQSRVDLVCRLLLGNKKESCANKYDDMRSDN